MKTKKGLIEFAVIGILMLMGLVIVAVPGLASSLLALAGPVQACSDAPFLSNCFCPEEQHRIATQGTLLQQYACEDNELALNPDDINFQEQVIDLGKFTMQQLYPGCSSFSCTDPGAFIQATSGYDWGATFKGRVAIVECKAPGQVLWNAVFDVKNAEVITSSCMDYVAPAPPPTTEPWLGQCKVITNGVDSYYPVGTYACVTSGRYYCSNNPLANGGRYWVKTSISSQLTVNDGVFALC